MTAVKQIKVLLVDPSLFTAPYDAALTEGLLAAGALPIWVTRPTREGDREEIPSCLTDPLFYRRTDNVQWLPKSVIPLVKGIAHLFGLAQLLVKVRRERPDIVHFQWVVLPLLDLFAVCLLRRWSALVLTVHDTIPYNGEKMGWLQRAGYDLPIKMAHRVIVHTRSGRQALIDRGLPARQVEVIPHGPLKLHADTPAPVGSKDTRWVFLLFGEIKPYKGLDVLIEALGLLPAELKQCWRVVVAGRPRMDVAPPLARVSELGLQDQFVWRLSRQTEAEMAILFAEADCFVFPYRQIDASGVYFLVKSLGKWVIASDVGIFSEDLRHGVQGALVPAMNPRALASALRAAVEARPAPVESSQTDDWREIGAATYRLYEMLLRERRATRLVRPVGVKR